MDCASGWRCTTLLGQHDPLVWGIFRLHSCCCPLRRGHGIDQLRSVILHELAHLKRRDPLAQWLTQLACALHWWNPLAWIAAWRIHVERERSVRRPRFGPAACAPPPMPSICSDATKPAAPRWSHTGGLAMAQKSSLESLPTRCLRRSATAASPP
ncbi:MAG: M56 family metallopeptidase [Verrucomicrobiales bacterium]